MRGNYNRVRWPVCKKPVSTKANVRLPFDVGLCKENPLSRHGPYNGIVCGICPQFGIVRWMTSVYTFIPTGINPRLEHVYVSHVYKYNY